MMVVASLVMLGVLRLMRGLRGVSMGCEPKRWAMERGVVLMFSVCWCVRGRSPAGE